MGSLTIELSHGSWLLGFLVCLPSMSLSSLLWHPIPFVTYDQASIVSAYFLSLTSIHWGRQQTMLYSIL